MIRWVPFSYYHPSEPKLWNYFHFDPKLMGVEFRRIPGPEEFYEMIAIRKNLENPYSQGIWYTFPDLKDEWSTRDFYSPHPTLQDHWMYKGRTDSLIVFANGHKLNPVSIEDTISGHPKIKGVLLTGHGRLQPALILEPASRPVTSDDEQALVDELWPLIKEADKNTVDIFRITRGLVMLNLETKPFVRAGKGSVMRKLTEELYKEEINALYGGFSKD